MHPAYAWPTSHGGALLSSREMAPITRVRSHLQLFPAWRRLHRHYHSLACATGEDHLNPCIVHDDWQEHDRHDVHPSRSIADNAMHKGRVSSGGFRAGTLATLCGPWCIASAAEGDETIYSTSAHCCKELRSARGTIECHDAPETAIPPGGMKRSATVTESNVKAGIQDEKAPTARRGQIRTSFREERTGPQSSGLMTRCDGRVWKIRRPITRARKNLPAPTAGNALPRCAAIILGEQRSIYRWAVLQNDRWLAGDFELPRIRMNL